MFAYICTNISTKANKFTVTLLRTTSTLPWSAVKGHLLFELAACKGSIRHSFLLLSKTLAQLTSRWRFFFLLWRESFTRMRPMLYGNQATVTEIDFRDDANEMLIGNVWNLSQLINE